MAICIIKINIVVICINATVDLITFIIFLLLFVSFAWQILTEAAASVCLSVATSLGANAERKRVCTQDCSVRVEIRTTTKATDLDLNLN
jgi:hypothetical protein